MNLQQGGYVDTILPLGNRLTVVASNIGVGTVSRLGDAAGQEPQGVTAVAAGETQTFGPYAEVARFTVACRIGSLNVTDSYILPSYSQDTGPSVPAGAISDSGLTMNTARLLGRTTAAVGAIEEITIGSGLSLLAGALTATSGGGGTVTATVGALTSNAIMLGAGSLDSKVLASLGTTTTVLHGNAAGAPSFGAVVLTTDVSGILPVANGGTAGSDAATARTNLGLGTLATQDGTFSGTSSGTNTGDQTSVTGNAGTATALATARAINGVNFDGTAAITVTAAAGTLSGTTLNATVVTSSLTSHGTITSGGLGAGAVLGGVTMTLGSDADGDIYYRSSNVLTRLAKGTGTQQLRMNAGATAPEWFTASSSGATTALDNLASVAINAALIPATAGALDFGSTTKPWGLLWFAGTSGTPGTNNFKITGASTSGTRTITFPDASITVARTDAGQTFTGVNVFTSPRIATSITDTNGNPMFLFTATASAVDGFTFTNAATANPATVTMAATGSDSNVNLALNPKGTGIIYIGGTDIGLFRNDSSYLSVGLSNTSNFAGLLVNASAGVAFGGRTSSFGQLRYSSSAFEVILADSSAFATIRPNLIQFAGTDNSLSRNAAGVLQFGTGSANASGSWLATNGTLSGNLSVVNVTTTATSSTGTAVIIDGSNVLRPLTSSLRFKTNVHDWSPSDAAMSAFLSLNPISFERKENNVGNELGFSAESLARVDSGLVNYDREGLPLSIREHALLAFMHEILRKQQAEITALKARIH